MAGDVADTAVVCRVHQCESGERVSEQLARRSVEHFLPTHESVRRWKVRRTKLQLPLVPGNVFVCLSPCDRIKVLQVLCGACLVGFGKRLPGRALRITFIQGRSR